MKIDWISIQFMITNLLIEVKESSEAFNTS